MTGAWVLGAPVRPAYAGQRSPTDTQHTHKAATSATATALERLAARADEKTAWPALRRYAESTKSAEQRGRAYLVLGYNENDAGDYAPAAADLGQAVATGFSLADFAAYYEGKAAEAGKQPDQAIAALQDFSTKYPASLLREKALEQLCEALRETNQGARVIELLAQEPKVHEEVALALLLARSYLQVQRLPEAAKDFQDVYYNFPTLPESDVAAAALKDLKSQLGAAFPAVTDEVATRRAELLFKASRFTDALSEYTALLQANSASPSADQWKVDRAHCLVRLKRPQEAIDSLSAGDWQNSAVNPERLATLVTAYDQLNKQAEMVQVLDELAKRYPQSPSYADALWAAGDLSIDQGDWKTAVGYYQTLAAAFPQSSRAREADWRAAWGHYLEGEKESAREAITGHLERYPASPHAAAALYWLGRLAEDRGDPPESRAFYDLVRRRFAQSYYAVQAGLRLRTLKAESSAGQVRLVRADTQGSPVALLAAKLAPRPEPAQLCAPAASRAGLPHLYFALKGLSLDDLAEQYLRLEMAERPRDPELLLALSRLEREDGNLSAALFDTIKLVPEYTRYEFSELPAEVWRMLYPEAYWNLVQRQARLNHVDPYLVMGLIRQESAFNPKATSGSNARGLMQMLPQTAAYKLSGRRRRLVANRLYDPAYNIRVACHYLSQMISAFQGNLEESMAAYNAGDTRVKQWLAARPYHDPAEFLESIPFVATRGYVEALLRDAAIYRQIMTGKVAYKRCS